MTSNLVMAEALAAWVRGWHPVPMGTGKHPCVSWRAFQTTRPPGHMVDRWFSPGSRFDGWGLIHGAAAGTIVIDFDNKPALSGGIGLVVYDAFDEFGYLPHTVSVETPSGGIHMLFKHPGVRVPTRKNLRPGLDVRGDGGFSVGAGTRISAGMYRWQDNPDDVPLAELPAAWVEFITENTISHQRSAVAATGGTRTVGDVTFGNFPTSFGGVIALAIDGRETHAVKTIWAARRRFVDWYGREPSYNELLRAARNVFNATTDLTREITTWNFESRVRKIMRGSISR